MRKIRISGAEKNLEFSLVGDWFIAVERTPLSYEKPAYSKISKYTDRGEF
jgi:hypothetical protein